MKFNKLTIENYKSFQYPTVINFPQSSEGKSIFLRQIITNDNIVLRITLCYTKHVRVNQLINTNVIRWI